MCSLGDEKIWKHLWKTMWHRGATQGIHNLNNASYPCRLVEEMKKGKGFRLMECFSRQPMWNETISQGDMALKSGTLLRWHFFSPLFSKKDTGFWNEEGEITTNVSCHHGYQWWFLSQTCSVIKGADRVLDSGSGERWETGGLLCSCFLICLTVTHVHTPHTQVAHIVWPQHEISNMSHTIQKLYDK